MDNIVGTAQVSKRTLYKYFPNKEAIFDELIEKLLESFCTYGNVAYSKTESIEKQLEKIINGKLEMMTAPGYMDISRLVLSEVMKGRKLSRSSLVS